MRSLFKESPQNAVLDNAQSIKAKMLYFMLISCPIILSYNYVKILATASQPAKLYTELPQFTFFKRAP